MQETPYIPPKLLIASSFEQLMQDYEKYGSYFTWLTEASEIAFDNLPLHDLVFVVADPGQGKSRLLKETARLLSETHKVIQIDLKLLGDKSDLEGAVLSELQVKSFAETQEDIAVTFDGLDEVAANQMLTTMNAIKSYISKHSTQKIFIASRLHFFSKHQSHFSGLTAEYVFITPLAQENAVKFLESFGLRNETIALITKTLRLRDGSLMIQNPRYLEMLIEWVKDNPDKLDLIDRAKIFSHFIDKALIGENSSGDDVAILKRRFLEKLALTMEAAQKDVITKDELMTFIDEANSDVSIILLGKVSFEDLYQHALLKENMDSLMFLNAEIQEYLASKAASRLKAPWRNIFDLAVDPHLREVYPSWINTMSFLIDEVPSILDAFLDLYSNKPEESHIENDLLHKVLSNVSPHLINDAQKERLFRWVFYYYVNLKLWLDSNDLAASLAFFATDMVKHELVQLASKEFPTDEERYYTLGNIAVVVKYIQEQGRFNAEEEAYWKQKFIEYARDDNDNGVLQRRALYGLVFFRDGDVLEQVKSAHDASDEMVSQAFESLCVELDPNHPTAVNTFIVGIRDKETPYARHGIAQINSPEALRIVIDALGKDKAFLGEFIGRELHFSDSDDDALLKNIEEKWQTDWLEPLKDVVKASNEVEHGYYAERSKFIRRLVELIARHDPSYFEELLNYGINSESGLALHYVDSHLARIMTVDDLPLIVQKINEAEKKHLLFRILISLKYPKIENPQAAQIEQAARAELPAMYKEYDAQVAEYKKNEEATSPISEELALRLSEAESGNYRSLLQGLQLAVRDVKDIDAEANQENIVKLWDCAKGQIIEPADPSQASFKINNAEGGQVTYTMSVFIQHLILVAKYAALYKFDISEYRAKFVWLIPYVYSQDIDDILELMGNLSGEESQQILATYEDLNSDLARYNPRNIVRVAQKYHNAETVPILNGLVDSDSSQIDEYLRKEAMKASELIKPDKERLQSLFEKLKEVPERKALLLEVVGLLISKHQDKPTFEWLISYLKDSAFEHVTPTGMHSVGAFEHELHEGAATQPLKEVTESEYVEQMIGLLDFSIELFEKGITWNNYALYLWKPIEAYFKNLIQEHSYGPLMELEKYVEKNVHRPGVNWFLRTFADIKHAYMAEMGKVSSFSDAIQRVNKLNSENYLPVQSARHLADIVYKLLNEDLRIWIEGEAKKIRGEVIEQKLLLIQLRYIFAKYGINPDEITILRESQLLDDTRTDFLVYYGFFGPIVVEMKLASHGDLAGRTIAAIQAKESYRSLEGYMQKYGAEHGIFLVYDDVERTPRKTWEKHLSLIEEAYSSIKGVKVVGLSFGKPPANTSQS